jgi:hypothetical protein
MPNPAVIRCRFAAGLCAAVLACASAAALHALDLDVTGSDVERAMAIARSSEGERARFHAAYVVSPVNDTVEQIEVVTEFRRLVMVGEARGLMGDWMFLHSVAPAQKAVEPWHGLVTVGARLRFHPLNVLTSIPPYTLVLGGEPAADPVAARTTPIWGQGGSTALLGANLEADFRAADVGQTTRAVRVVLERGEVASASVDFARLP